MGWCGLILKSQQSLERGERKRRDGEVVCKYVNMYFFVFIIYLFIFSVGRAQMRELAQNSMETCWVFFFSRGVSQPHSGTQECQQAFTSRWWLRVVFRREVVGVELHIVVALAVVVVVGVRLYNVFPTRAEPYQ
jgi:hypothetical protein